MPFLIYKEREVVSAKLTGIYEADKMKTDCKNVGWKR